MLWLEHVAVVLDAMDVPAADQGDLWRHLYGRADYLDLRARFHRGESAATVTRELQVLIAAARNDHGR